MKPTPRASVLGLLVGSLPLVCAASYVATPSFSCCCCRVFSQPESLTDSSPPLSSQVCSLLQPLRCLLWSLGRTRILSVRTLLRFLIFFSLLSPILGFLFHFFHLCTVSWLSHPLSVLFFLITFLKKERIYTEHRLHTQS